MIRHKLLKHEAHNGLRSKTRQPRSGPFLSHDRTIFVGCLGVRTLDFPEVGQDHL